MAVSVLSRRRLGRIRGTAAKSHLSSIKLGLADLKSDKAGLVGVTVLVLLIIAATLGPLIAPHDPARQDLTARLQPPLLFGGSWEHVLGTDGLGRDIFSRLLSGSRITLLVGVLVCLIAGTAGVLAGLLSGYRAGRVDQVVMTTVDTQLAFPGLLLVLLVLGLVGPSIKTLVIVLAINGWMVYARVSRGISLSLRETPYIEAADLMGCSTRRVMFRHLLPNLTAPLLTLTMLEFARIILAEAALSYLGYGVQPPQVSWGLMVAEGQQYLATAWWVMTFPGIAIALTVLGVNLFASWLRVQADPNAREARFARSTMEGADT
jgi:peptide/nickel transport system permease protein